MGWHSKIYYSHYSKYSGEIYMSSRENQQICYKFSKKKVNILNM